MAHVEHYKAADVKRLGNEWTRDRHYKDKDGRIDRARTPNNYVMDDSVKAGGHKATRSGYGVQSTTMARVGEVPHSARSDLNVLSDWVITCPQELVSDPVKVERFFKVSYGFVCDRYGHENVINGYVHMDETTPHMHVPLVPVKDGRISSKALFTRKELSAFHDELDKLCEVEFGMKGLIRNGRTKGGYTTAELKERSRQKDAQKAREAALDAREANIQAEIEKGVRARSDAFERARREAEQEKAETQAERERLRSRIATCDALLDGLRNTRLPSGKSYMDVARGNGVLRDRIRQYEMLEHADKDDSPQFGG